MKNLKTKAKNCSDVSSPDKVTRHDISYNLTEPCSDCPFKIDAKWHSGVFESLESYHSRMERGEFAHTCHKTDPRSDGYSKAHIGPIEHCAGALILCESDESIQGQLPAILALKEGKYDPSKLNMDSGAFKKVTDMIKHYYKLYRENEVQIKIRYR